MFCNNCGTPIPEESNFCPNCGKPNEPNLYATKLRWETCEIAHTYVKTGGLITKHKSKFVAEAIGPKGVYVAEESAVFEHRFGTPGEMNDSGYQQTIDAHKSLIYKLVEAGWEPKGDRGDQWWMHRFQRRVR